MAGINVLDFHAVDIPPPATPPPVLPMRFDLWSKLGVL